MQEFAPFIPELLCALSGHQTPGRTEPLHVVEGY